jgi:2-methylfumaryl-CoA hydratase
VRWVMVQKRSESALAPEAKVPSLSDHVDVKSLGAAVPKLKTKSYDNALAGSARRFSDYKPGEKIDHRDGMTVEEAEHQLATRLYQNTARVHFDQFHGAEGRFGRRLIYGGHVISLARALSFNGLENVFHVAAINGGRHVAPLFAGCTVFAWTQILECREIPKRKDIGALRLRTIATKDKPCSDFPLKAGDDYDPAVILDLDYWAVIVR